MKVGRKRIALASATFGLMFTLGAIALAGKIPVSGPTTLDIRIGPSAGGGFVTLDSEPGEGYQVRDATTDGFGELGDSRHQTRRHLAYFSQTTDVHLTDEESPARVEFLDPDGGPFSSAWRPAEALGPFEAKAMIDRINQLAEGSPNRDGQGRSRPMDFLVNSGDVSDNQHYNEVLWNRILLEGGTIDPGSGVAPAASIGSNPLCPEGLDIRDAANPDAYTGVQDIDDWPGSMPGYFYDPDDPAPYGPDTEKVNPYRTAPTWPGLMDRAQQPFTTPGVKVPSYVLTGNHDGLVQGNVWATGTFNRLATGCLKPMNDAFDNGGFSNGPLFGLVTDSTLTVDDMLDLYRDNPGLFTGVPPDPDRRLISKKTFKKIFESGRDPRGHGFGLVDRAELRASDGTAGYYSFSPRRGMRVVVLDTVSEGGKVLSSSNGNIDAPQFNWFEEQLQEATADNELVVVFSHHPISSLTAGTADEAAPSCATVDVTLDVGCDSDPRVSTPVARSNEAITLMHRYPHAIAWVSGHTHENRIRPYAASGGNSGFWSIETASLADWPKQGRLLDLFDNRDGTLSLVTTMIDHAAPIGAPAPGTPGSSMSASDLAALSRTLSYNDTQNGLGGGEGTVLDRNVELSIIDPRRAEPTLYPWGPKPGRIRLEAGRSTTVAVKVSNEGNIDTGSQTIAIRASGRGLKPSGPRRVAGLPVGGTTTVRVRLKTSSRSASRGAISLSVTGRRIEIPVLIRR